MHDIHTQHTKFKSNFFSSPLLSPTASKQLTSLRTLNCYSIILLHESRAWNSLTCNLISVSFHMLTTSTRHYFYAALSVAVLFIS